MRARTKFAIMILLITVVLSLVILGSHQFFQQQTVAEAEEEVTSIAGLTAEQVDESVAERRDFIGFIASRTSVDDFDEIEGVLTEVTQNSRFWAAHLVDENQTMVDFQGDIEDAERAAAIGTVVDEPYVEAAFTGRTVVSDPLTATVDGESRHYVVVSSPILESDGTVRGAISAAIFVDDRTFLQSTSPLETDVQAVEVTGPNGEELKSASNEFDEPIVASHATEHTDWTVTIQRDRTVLTDRLETLAIVQGGSLLVVLLTIVGFSVWEYRSNLQQAEKLLDAFDAIADGNYTYQLSLSAAEEWKQISEGYRTLAAGLAEREAKLRERQERLDVLNRVLRHNVRNEMSVIVNYADIIKEFTDDDQLETAAETILSSGRDLTALSETAKQIRTAFDDGDRLVAYDLSELVDESVAPVTADYPNAAIQLELPEELSVAGIPAITMALENLLENACEHAETDEPVVTITADQEGEMVAIAVADNGPGIPEQEYAVLEKGKETALEHGSGLGLWLVHWVVSRSGGDLSFEDNEPGGSIVTMRLPAGDRIDELTVSVGRSSLE